MKRFKVIGWPKEIEDRRQSDRLFAKRLKFKIDILENTGKLKRGEKVQQYKGAYPLFKAPLSRSERIFYVRLEHGEIMIPYCGDERGISNSRFYTNACTACDKVLKQYLEGIDK